MLKGLIMAALVLGALVLNPQRAWAEARGEGAAATAALMLRSNTPMSRQMRALVRGFVRQARAAPRSGRNPKYLTTVVNPHTERSRSQTVTIGPPQQSTIVNRSMELEGRVLHVNKHLIRRNGTNHDVFYSSFPITKPNIGLWAVDLVARSKPLHTFNRVAEAWRKGPLAVEAYSATRFGATRPKTPDVRKYSLVNHAGERLMNLSKQDAALLSGLDPLGR